jgi:hypothetical protein
VAYSRWRATGSEVDRERFAALADRGPDLDPRRGSDPETVLYDLMATTARFVGGRLSGAERGAVRSRLAAWRSFGGDDLFSVCVRYRAARLADELGS